VNCDRPYWFDVLVTANTTRSLAVGSEFSVACTDNTIFVTVNGDEVRVWLIFASNFCVIILLKRQGLQMQNGTQEFPLLRNISHYGQHFSRLGLDCIDRIKIKSTIYQDSSR
jgi:hypothetical protein